MSLVSLRYSPLHRGSFLSLLTLLTFLLSWGLPGASRGEVALRPLTPVMVSKGMARSADPVVRKALEEKTTAVLQKELVARFPEAAAAGKARENSASVNLELSDLLHLGLRLSRAQLRTIHFGNERTDFHLAVTGTLFVVNLGTGEVLAARSLTARASSKKSGNVNSPPADLLAGLTDQASNQLVTELATRLGKEFKPGRIEAKVVDTYRGVVVLGRGYMDGAYNGEVFQLPGEGGKPARNFSIFQTQDRLSLARPTSPGGLPKNGDTLVRFGMAATASNTPRLMVARAPEDGDASVPPGVAVEDVDQWAEDLLADAGFVVIPSAGDLVRAQLKEAAQGDVAEKALVGAQVSPDLAVIARVDRHQRLTRFDEKSSSENLVMEVTTSLAFVDVRTGAVLYGASASESRQDVIQEGGKQFDPDDIFPGLTKDALLAVATKAASGFKPRLATGKADKAAGSSLSWPVSGIPAGQGTVVEVYRAAKEVKDGKGGSYGFVEELVGTAKVIESDPKREKAQVMALTTTALPGLRIKAVSGTAAADTRLVAVGNLDMQGGSGISWKPSASQLRSLARTGLYSSGAFRAVVDGDLISRLQGATNFLSSGAFEAGGDAVAEVKAASPTHLWVVDVKLSAQPLAQKAGGKVSRTLRVDVGLTLVDGESGQPVTLKTSKGDTMTRFPYYLERTLEAKESKGKVAVGMADEDLPANFELLLLDAFTKAAAATRKLADGGTGG